MPGTPPNHPQPNFASIFLTILISWIILIPLINLIKIPLTLNQTGVISLATIQQISPYTDYLKYLILLLTPPLITAITFHLSPQSIHLPFPLKKINTPQTWLILTLILITAWIIDQNFTLVGQRGVPSWGNLITDSFHEGEYLGFLPTFLQQEKPFLNTFFVHGFGLNALPSLIAAQLTDLDHRIALTRLLVIVENLITSLGYFWVLAEITQSFKFKTSRRTIWLIASLAFCILESTFFYIDGRRSALFLIQLALTLRYFRHPYPTSIFTKILPLIIGVSLPLSLLYVYDRAAYFIFIYVCISCLSLWTNRNLIKPWFVGSGIGIMISFLLLLATLGWQQISAIVDQVFYWIKYGKYISYIPLAPLHINFFTQSVGIAIIIQATGTVYLLLDLKAKNFKWRPFLEQNFVVIILGLASVMYMRMMLDRSDHSHLTKGASITVLLGYYLILLIYQRWEPDLLKIKFSKLHQILFAIFLSLFIIAEPGFNLAGAVTQLRKIPPELAKPDQEFIQPDYLAARRHLHSQIQQQSCFFTLTSEGLWYYLFNQPSCSKFSYLYYAKPTVAQHTVIEDLETQSPELILFQNEMWSNSIDGFSTANSNSLIYQYILQNYQPDQFIENHWFWRRRRHPLKFLQNDSIRGFLDHRPDPLIQQGEVASISGWGILPNLGQAVNTVYLTLGENNQPIAVSPVNLERADVALNFTNANYLHSGWTLTIPTYIIPPGQNILRVWGTDQASENLIQIGQDILVQLTIHH